MKFTSPVYSAVSGSIAGITYAHNRGGMYARARALPTNPNTDPQVSARDAMRNGVIAWGASTPTVRASWEDYAANVPMLDKLGESRPLTGQQQFLRTYLSRSGAGLTMVATAPVIFNLGAFTPFTGTGASATDDLEIEYGDTDPWANGVGGYATISLGLQQGPGVNFYKSPFAISAIVLGAALPPSGTETIVYGTPLGAGNKVWVKYVVGQLDGRVSTPSIFPVTVV